MRLSFRNSQGSSRLKSPTVSDTYTGRESDMPHRIGGAATGAHRVGGLAAGRVLQHHSVGLAR